MATLEQHTARWLELPWVESMWNKAKGRELLPAIQRRIIMPMLELGLDPGRHRFDLKLDRDSTPFMRIVSRTPAGSTGEDGKDRQWLLRPKHADDDEGWMETLRPFIAFLADHYRRKDRILAHMGEAGRFRRSDPAWSYDVHPVMAAHLRGHDVEPDEFVRGVVTGGPFRSNERCMSKPSDAASIICSLPERLGYMDGDVRLGTISLGRIDLSSDVTFVGSRNAVVVRRCEFPQTVLAGIVGQPATMVVDHHAFDVPDLIVTATRRRKNNVEFLVECGMTPFAAGRPADFDAPAVAIPCQMTRAA